MIECASIKEANTAAEALSITASLRGYFDDVLSPPRPKRTVKMERVVVSVKNCQMGPVTLAILPVMSCEML